MPRELRLKVAREYLKLLERHQEPKKAMLHLRRTFHGVSRRSVYRYVSELRA